MIERAIEYLANAVWQLPLLAVGAWWLLRSARLGPGVQHRVWVAVLGLGVLLPLARVGPVAVSAPREGLSRPMEAAPALVGVRVESDVLKVDRVVAPGKPSVSAKPRASSLVWARGLLRRRSVRVSGVVARWIAGFYLMTVLIGVLRIVRAWGAARRLVLEAQEMVLDDRAQQLMDECGRIMGIGSPRVVESAAVLSPAVVGVMRPVLLLPEGFGGYTEDEMGAALLHEMAHIGRRDYAANLMCEIAGLPLVWHPVAYAVQRRIRSTREMVCDAMAAGEMKSPVLYARSLVTLASGRFGGREAAGAVAVGLFTNNNLEERVMQLTEAKQVAGLRTKAVRVMTAVAGVVVVVALAAMVHVTPVLAQAPTQATPPAQATSAAVGAQTAAAPVESGQSVPQEDVSTGDEAQGTAVGTSAGAGQSSSQSTSGSGQVGSTPADGLNVGLTPSDVLADVDKDCPMGHGTNAHHWTTSEGKQFSVVNCEAAEPTPAEKKRYEQEFKKQTAALDQLKVEDLKLDGLKELKDLDDVKMRMELAKLQSPEFKLQMKLQMDGLQKQMAELKLDGPNLKKQMAKLSGEDMKQQMAALNKQIAESGLQSLDAQKQLQVLDSVEIQKQMADLDRELDGLTRQYVDVKVRVEVQEQLKEARKHLDEARKQMDEEKKKHLAVPCTEPCSAQPQ